MRVRIILRKGALDDVEDIMQRSEFDGMMTANQSLQRLVESGQVEAEKAIAVSPRPNELTQALRGRSLRYSGCVVKHPDD